MAPAPFASSASGAAVRAMATTGAPAAAKAVAMPRPRPRLAPTTIVVVSDRSLVGMVVAPLRGSVGSVGGGEAGLRLADRGLGHGVRELVAADQHEDRREREQRDRTEHPERVLEAAGECRRAGVAGVEQRGGVAGGDARGDRDPDRSPNLLAGVQKPGGQSRSMLLDARQGADRDRDERER